MTTTTNTMETLVTNNQNFMNQLIEKMMENKADVKEIRKNDDSGFSLGKTMTNNLNASSNWEIVDCFEYFSI